MKIHEDFRHYVQFSVQSYIGDFFDFYEWLNSAAGKGNYSIPHMSHGLRLSGGIRFKDSEAAMLFKLSNPFKYPLTIES